MPLDFVATALDGTVHGDITNADERNVRLSHMRVPSASFKIPLNHYLADTLAITDCLVKVYRTDPVTLARNLIFHGPVVSTEEVGDANTQTVAVTCAGPFWRLTKRIIPGSDVRSTGGLDLGMKDLGQMAHDVLNIVNSAEYGFTGIWPGSLTASRDGQVDNWILKNAAEAISELATGVDSFEYVVQPTEPVNRAMTWPQIGLLNIAPTIGVSRPDAIFEYGTTRANVASYNRRVDREGILTRGYISVNGWPNGTTQDLLTYRATPEAIARGLFEEVIPEGGITNDVMREDIVEYHVQVRKDPRHIITFTPALNARPAPVIDYDVGDFVRARAVVGGSTRFDSLMRVWGITYSADVNGNESVELALVEDS